LQQSIAGCCHYMNVAMARKPVDRANARLCYILEYLSVIRWSNKIEYLYILNGCQVVIYDAIVR